MRRNSDDGMIKLTQYAIRYKLFPIIIFSLVLLLNEKIIETLLFDKTNKPEFDNNVR